MVQVLALAVTDVAGGVLATAGIMKLFQPGAFADAVAAVRIPRRVAATATRVVGLAELATALALTFVGGHWPMAALSVWYVAFTAVSVRLVRVDAPSCGCFGHRSAPASWTHVAVDAVAAVAAVGLTIVGAGSLVDRLGPGLFVGFAYVAFAALGVTATVATMTGGVELATLVRRPSVAPR